LSVVPPHYGDEKFLQVTGKILAWVESHCENRFVAAFVGEHAVLHGDFGVRGRLPATQICPSFSAAKSWVEERAAEFALPVEWLDQSPN
jgi:hypothetical protein